MAETPRVVLDYLAALVLETRSPAYIRVDGLGGILGWGGDTPAYRLPSLAEGEPIGLVLSAVDGLIPHSGEPIRLPAVELNSGQFVDVHVFSGDDHTWILLTDATLETMQQAMLQQRLNEVNLIRGWHARAADDRISRLDADVLVEELPAFSEEGERLEVAAAQISLHMPRHPKPELALDDLEPLGRALRAAAEAVTHESGYVSTVTQNSMTALFGVLPSGATPQTHAIRAVRAAAEALRSVSGKDGEVAPVGVGIATGFVSAGIVSVAGGRMFVAVGECLERAERLAREAGAGRVLVDVATLKVAGESGVGFVADGDAFALDLK